MKVRFLVSVFIFIATFLLLLYFREFFSKKEFSHKVEQKVKTTILQTQKISVSDALSQFMKIRDMHAGQKVEVTKTLGENLIYQVVYSYDSAGLRNSDVDQGMHPHLILSGCSGVFGEGVGEDHTLARLLSNKIQRPVLNFGIAGSAHHDHIEFLELLPSDYVKNKKGNYVFFYWDDLLKRATLDPSYLMWSGPERPYFFFDVEGSLRRGKIKDSEEWSKYQNAKKMNLEHNYLSLASADSFSDQKIKLSAAIILELKKTYLRLFPEGKFYFAFHPLFSTNPEHKSKMIQHLSAFNIEVLDVQSIGSRDNSNIYIPHDGHPSEHGYELFAQLIESSLVTLK